MKKRWLFLLLMTFAVTACLAPVKVPQVPREKTGRLLLYLEPLPQEARHLAFSLAGLAARREDGREIVLPVHVSPIEGAKLVGVQTRLLSVPLPPGRYRGLSLRLGGAFLLEDQGETVLQVAAEPLQLDQEFTMAKGKNVTLFLSLAGERLVGDGGRFHPRFSLWTPQRVLINLKGFVSNTGADSLTVIDKRTPKVVGTVATGAGPEGLALDPVRGWVYLAQSGADSVAAVEVSNSLIMGSVQLHLGDKPSELALSPSGRTLVTVNPGSNTASIIDAATLTEVDRVRFTSQPTDVFMGPVDDLAYVLFPSTNTLAVLDLSLSRQVRYRSVVLDETAVRGVVGSDGRHLYLITSFSPNLLVVDASTLAVAQRIFVGGGSLCITADRTRGLLYLGKKSGEIAVVDPGMGVQIDSFSLPGPVRFLAIDREENSLFAVLPQQQEVRKFDLVSKRYLGTVTVDEGAHAMVVMGEK